MKMSGLTRTRSALAAACFVAILALSLFALSACAGQETSASEPTAAAAEPGSLLAIHTNGQLEAGDYTPKTCLGCHNRTELNASTEGYGGDTGTNPHSAHEPAGTCTDCHSVSGQSTIKCNSCHAWEVPEGWTEPEIAPARQTDLVAR